MENKFTELHEKLSKLQWLLHRHHMMNHAEHGPCSDTSRGQGRVLAALKMQPDISTKDLSYLLGIRVPSLNELLSKLEKGGYIVRKPSDADKRVMLMQLTGKGKATQPADTDHGNIFDCLNEDEAEKFAEYLDRVTSSLETQIDDVPDEQAMHHWMRGARSRMGDERFENFMSMRRGCFHGEVGAIRRGEAHDHAPCAERMSPDYDGLTPEGREMSFGWGRKRKQCASAGAADHDCGHN